MDDSTQALSPEGADQQYVCQTVYFCAAIVNCLAQMSWQICPQRPCWLYGRSEVPPPGQAGPPRARLVKRHFV